MMLSTDATGTITTVTSSGSSFHVAVVAVSGEEVEPAAHHPGGSLEYLFSDSPLSLTIDHWRLG